MKNGILKIATTVLPLMGLLTWSACQAVNFPEDEHPEISEHKLTVLTRSINQEIIYPVHVYAFDSDGRLQDSQELASMDEQLSLHLPPGRFRVVGVMGSTGNSLPEKPTLQTEIAMPSGNYALEPLSMGQADVQMGEQSQTLSLMMAHRVARLDITLKDVPSDVTEVQVAVSSPYTRISLQGEEGAPETVVVPCTYSSGVWKTGEFYVLPTPQAAIMSISLKGAAGTETYGYTHAGVLSANTPYIINGSYTDGVVLQGGFLEQEWGNTVVQNFSFGPGAANEVEEGGATDTDEVITVDEIPEAASLWNGFLVAAVEETADGADLLLLSLNEWQGLTSANYTTDPDVARNLALQYSENGWTGWSIPTKAQAQQLMADYVGKLQLLNDPLSEANGVPVQAVDAKSAAVRYLCEDGVYSFSFAAGTKLSQAGAKINTYHLRLVKRVSVILEN